MDVFAHTPSSARSSAALMPSLPSPRRRFFQPRASMALLGARHLFEKYRVTFVHCEFSPLTLLSVSKVYAGAQGRRLRAVVYGAVANY
jgi:hypothetical protein